LISSFPPNNEVELANTPQLDAFGRLRVSEPFGVYDNKNISSRNRNQWEEPINGLIIQYTPLAGVFGNGNEIRGTLPTGYFALGTILVDTPGVSMTVSCDHNDFQIGDTITDQTTGATATINTVNTGANIVYNYDRSSVLLSVTSTATDSAVRHTHRYSAYVPGKSQLIFETFIAGTTDNVSFLLRTSTSGSVDDTRKIAQSDWNIDGFDLGVNVKNPSGKTIDFTKTQIMVIDFQWLGVGAVAIGFNIDGVSYPAHVFFNANSLDVVYMKTPTLPPRFEISNSGSNTIKRIGYGDTLNGIFLESTELTSGSDKELEEICISVSSEGGYTLPGLEFSTPVDWGDERAITARTPLLAIRLKNQFPTGEPNRKIVKYLDMGAFVRTNDCLLQIAHIHEAVDITATWTDVGGGSAVEYSTDITAVTGRPEHIVDMSIIAAAGGAGRAGSEIISGEFLNLHGFISQNSDSTNSELFVIYGIPRTGTSQVLPHITFVEFE
jgi:hypothetical protein